GLGQLRAPADGGEADVLLADLLALGEEVLVEQGHEQVELGLRPLPVLDAEAVQGELLDAEAAALLDGGADALDAAAVALDAGQAAAAGPAAVAVHDDGDVPRQPGGVEAGLGDARQRLRRRGPRPGLRVPLAPHAGSCALLPCHPVIPLTED